MAACIAILSINLAKKNELIKEQLAQNKDGGSFSRSKTQFFDKCKMSGQNLINVSMWNNPDVLRSSGYTIEQLKEPLFLLAQCLKDGMKSNQMDDFNIEQIKSIKNFKGCSGLKDADS